MAETRLEHTKCGTEAGDAVEEVGGRGRKVCSYGGGGKGGGGWSCWRPCFLVHTAVSFRAHPHAQSAPTPRSPLHLMLHSHLASAVLFFSNVL